jgi:hypothetical protein
MIKEFSPTFLYRSDLNQPPKQFATTFNNPKYLDSHLGYKNQAGLFFFTDSRDIANCLAQNECVERKSNNYFLTTVSVNKPLQLIDFTNSFNIYQMLCVLTDLGINVLTSNFKTFEDSQDFKSLDTIFNAAEEAIEPVQKFDDIQKIKMHSNSSYEDIGLFGQRLTDFQNGIHFKQIMTDQYPNIDGYTWREFGDDRGYSYCLFEPVKLEIHNVQQIACR